MWPERASPQRFRQDRVTVKGRSEFLSPSSNPAGVRLHALRWGDASAPVVVLLHGGGANAHWWDHLAPGLARRLLRLVHSSATAITRKAASSRR